MNARELLALTRNNRHTSDVIRGIFSSNNLPFLVSKHQSAYICNTDPSYLPGSHWVVFWMHSPIQAEFYDSWTVKGILRYTTILLLRCFYKTIVNNVCSIIFRFKTETVIRVDIMYCFIYG